MIPRAGRALAIVAATLAILVAAAVVVVHRLREPVIPAVVVRSADARRLLSKSIPARIDRMIHDHPPADRSGNPRLIALTFDDGPYPVDTPLLLDVLDDLHVPATFFLIGDDATRYPQLVRRIASSGDEIANHTQTHPARFDLLGPAAVTRELAEGAATLGRYAHDPAIRHMMRPPHGRFTVSTVETAQRDGYDVMLWNDDPGDWRLEQTPTQIVDHLGAHATAPEVVLLHSGRLNTIEALPSIVARFRAAGFTFVTAGQLLGRVGPDRLVHPGKLRV